MALRWIASAVLAAALGLVLAPSVLAAEVRSGDTITIAPDEVVTDDLYAFGNNVVVQGTVRGDVVAAGSIVDVTGHVTGSVMAAGNSVTVSGPVDGSIRVAGSTLTVGGLVGTDVLLAGSTSTINPPARVGRDVLGGGNSINILAPVARNVNVGGGTLTLGSSVGGAVKANVTDLVLTDGADIAGPVLYVSPNDATTRGGARTAQPLQRTPPTERAANPWEFVGVDVLGWLRGLVGIAVFGSLLALVFPRAAAAATTTVEQRWLASVGLGFALVAGLPILAMFVLGLGLLVGGWWIGLLVLTLYAALLVTGYVTTAGWLGMAAAHLARVNVHPVIALLIGLVLMGLVVLVPFVGPLVGFVALLMGVGALGLSGYTAYRASRPVPNTEANIPPAPLRAAA